MVRPKPDLDRESGSNIPVSPKPTLFQTAAFWAVQKDVGCADFPAL